MRAEPRRTMLAVNGIDLTVFEWVGTGSDAATAPVVLLLHATGFHARVWDATVAALPPHLRVIAIDQRGHGRSGDKQPIMSWSQFADDTLSVIEHFALRDIIGVGHSMGGQVITAAALRRPQAFRSLVLVDPVMPEPHVYGFNRYGNLAGPHEHPIAQRRNRWVSWQAMRDAFAGRSPYSLWQPRILDDYCRHGVLPAPDGEGVVLACPPVVEASVYMRSRDTRILERLHEVALPVTILRAKYTPLAATGHVDFTRSSTWAGLAPLFGNARDVYLPDLTHFIPMQAPDVVADYVGKAIGDT